MANEKGEKTQLYFKGANSDINLEVQSLDEGVYLYAINMRLSQEGEEAVLTKIGSPEDQGTDIATELAVYGTDYVCVGACMCKGHKIALWANIDKPTAHEHCISIDDNIMLASDDFPISEAYPVQIVVNENAFGGEIYLHDKRSVPLLFNIDDIITEWNFNPEIKIDSTFTQDGGDAWEGQPVIDKSPTTGVIMMIFRGGAGHLSNNSSKVLGIKSVDNGVNWVNLAGGPAATPTVILSMVGWDYNNFHGGYTQTGRFIITGRRNLNAIVDETSFYPFEIYSDNDGVNWSAELDFAAKIGNYFHTWGQQSKLIRLSDGGIAITGNGSKYLVYPNYDYNGMIICKSYDDGITWLYFDIALNDPFDIDVNWYFAEPYIAEIATGVILCICRDESTARASGTLVVGDIYSVEGTAGEYITHNGNNYCPGDNIKAEVATFTIGAGAPVVYHTSSGARQWISYDNGVTWSYLGVIGWNEDSSKTPLLISRYAECKRKFTIEKFTLDGIDWVALFYGVVHAANDIDLLVIYGKVSDILEDGHMGWDHGTVNILLEAGTYKNMGYSGVYFLDDNTLLHGWTYETNVNTSTIKVDTCSLGSKAYPSTKYFADFNVRLYQAQLTSSLSIPVFINLEYLGGNNGLCRGSYTYSMRYVTADGTGTEWGPSTPIIPVPERSAKASSSNYHLDAAVYGGVPDLNNPTKYGIKLRIRVTNEGGFSYIELKRLSYNTTQSLDYIPVAEKTIVTEIDITENSYTVVDVIDSNDRIWTAIPSSELESFSAIEKVNTITYFDNRLIEMGPTYQSRVVDSTSLFLSHNENDKVAYPYIKELFERYSNTYGYGYVDIWNQVYRKSYMRGEKYGWAVIIFSSISGKSFAVPYYDGSGATGIGDFRNYRIPNRREVVSKETEYVSNDIVYAADVDSHDGASNNYVHEVFDQQIVITKNIGTVTIGNSYTKYFPLTPTGSEGSYGGNAHSLNAFKILPCDQAEGNAYDPPGWTPGIYALGMQFQGIDDSILPDWASGFSIVRTKPAGRIICQGLAVYSLTQGDPSINDPATKALDEFWFYSPDIDPAVSFNSGLFEELIESGSDYKIQLVSPLGFWSELYSGKDTDNSVVDFISYAKMFYEDNRYNPTNNAAAVIGWQDGYVSFGRWRNHAAAAGADMSAGIFGDWNGDLSFGINDISKNTIDGLEGRSEYLKITTSYDMYKTSDPGVNCLHNDPTVTKWHEPVYIVNIINENADVDIESNVQKYYSTGHCQKLNSLLGFASGSVINFDLVDERYEDVIVDEHVCEGSHTGANNLLVLTDITKVWSFNVLVGCTVINTTDYCCGVIVSNTVTTATVIGLSGGTDNDFDTNDTYIIIRDCDYVYKGVHTGGAGAANLTDGLKTWVVDELVGYTIKNVTDGSWAVITANSATVVTTALAGGGSNDWQVGEEYWISANRYIYVDDKPWLTNIPMGKYATIVAALNASGKWDDGNREIYGVCKGNYRLDRYGNGLLSIIYFDNTYFDNTYGGAIATDYTIPSEDDRIEVRYDNRIPIKVFGGDTFINDCIWADVDAKMEWDKTTAQNQANCFGLAVAYPYFNYDTTAQYWQVTAAGARISNIQVDLDYIRQHVWQFTCESRANMNLLGNDVFPKKHYVQRPLQIDDTEIANGAAAVYLDNGILPYYEDDYGDEYLLWQYGGFKFPVVEINRGYSAYLNDNVFYAKPLVGFEEQLYFPNKVLFSQQRILPGEMGSIKSFPALNVFDTADFAGEITFAHFANTLKGDNLYAITESGICLLITNKSILSSLTGEEVLMTGANDFILGQYWISKDYGMNDEMWRSAVAYNNILFWVNNESVFMLAENKIDDIGRKGFYQMIYDNAISQIGAGYATDISSVVDQKHKEFWFMCVDIIGGPKIFVYDIRRQAWIGYFEPSGGITGYYISDTQNVYHFKNDLELYRENQGYNETGEVIQVVTPALGKDVEYVDIKINSTNKPTSVEFADSEKNLYQSILNVAKGDRYLRDYGYWYNKIPRKEREANGTHTGAANAVILTDSNQAWGINTLVGMIIYNDTDGSVGVITANTVNTVTSQWQVDIDNIIDYGGTVAGTVKVQTKTDHGFVTGQTITIDGTVNYDGAYVITVVDADEFYFTVVFVAVESGYGTATGCLSGGAQNDWDVADVYYIEGTKKYRLQNRHMVYKITHSANEPFSLISTTIGYKVLRRK